MASAATKQGEEAAGNKGAIEQDSAESG